MRYMKFAELIGPVTKIGPPMLGLVSCPVFIPYYRGGYDTLKMTNDQTATRRLVRYINLLRMEVYTEERMD